MSSPTSQPRRAWRCSVSLLFALFLLAHAPLPSPAAPVGRAAPPLTAPRPVVLPPLQFRVTLPRLRARGLWPVGRPRGYYWGAWIDSHRTGAQPPWDMSGVLQLEQQVGKGMSLVHFGTPMAYGNGTDYYDFPGPQFNTIRNHGSIPFFSWSTHAMDNYGHPDFTLRAIVEGRQDAHIRAWAEAARAWGDPFFLRFNWEMNGAWFPWGEGHEGNQPGDFVAAWRHVHDIFASVGAQNATWVWCPTADKGQTLVPLAGLYPGGDYVDWTCLDGYNGNNPWATFSDLMGSTYDRIAQMAPDKPMVIGETASTEGGRNKAAWIQSMFSSLPRRFPKVRALIWFDKTEAGPGGATDWILDSSSSATRAFAKGVADESYESRRSDR